MESRIFPAGSEFKLKVEDVEFGAVCTWMFRRASESQARNSCWV